MLACLLLVHTGLLMIRLSLLLPTRAMWLFVAKGSHLIVLVRSTACSHPKDWICPPTRITLLKDARTPNSNLHTNDAVPQIYSDPAWPTVFHQLWQGPEQSCTAPVPVSTLTTADDPRLDLFGGVCIFHKGCESASAALNELMPRDGARVDTARQD